MQNHFSAWTLSYNGSLKMAVGDICCEFREMSAAICGDLANLLALWQRNGKAIWRLRVDGDKNVEPSEPDLYTFENDVVLQIEPRILYDFVQDQRGKSQVRIRNDHFLNSSLHSRYKHFDGSPGTNLLAAKWPTQSLSTGSNSTEGKDNVASGSSVSSAAAAAAPEVLPGTYNSATRKQALWNILKTKSHLDGDFEDGNWEDYARRQPALVHPNEKDHADLFDDLRFNVSEFQGPPPPPPHFYDDDRFGGLLSKSGFHGPVPRPDFGNDARFHDDFGSLGSYSAGNGGLFDKMGNQLRKDLAGSPKTVTERGPPPPVPIRTYGKANKPDV
jgi:hypothetical protein